MKNFLIFLFSCLVCVQLWSLSAHWFVNYVKQSSTFENAHKSETIAINIDKIIVTPQNSE